MSQLIDPKDLCVGSYVQDPDGTLLRVKEINGFSIVLDAKYTRTIVRGDSETTDTLWHDAHYDIKDLRPIPITRERLLDLGGKLAVNSSSIILAHFDHRGTFTIFESAGEWWLKSGYVTIANPKSIHHLQAILWQLERVWLTMDGKEVSHE